ncbi:MAG: IS630 family transposase [Gammaproteobacteria bacterium]|nr:IS630 family transposase [Gammaproteobacteria bacterium]
MARHGPESWPGINRNTHEGERFGRPRRLLPAQWRKLQGELRRSPRAYGLTANLWDGPLLAEHLRRHYDADLGVRQCQRVCRQMGFRLRKPRPQVAQSDPLKVAAVKKLRRLARQPGVELWSLDECHFQQHGTRCRMWVAPEIKDPVLQHAPTRKSVACFGAVNLRNGLFVRTFCPVFNAETFQSFLRQLLRHRSVRSRMIIVLDNARYHHARLLHPFLRKYRRGASTGHVIGVCST